MGLALLFIMAFGTALSGALMPGPVLFATVHWSAQHGRWVGPLIAAGHAVVEAPLGRGSYGVCGGIRNPYWDNPT